MKLCNFCKEYKNESNFNPCYIKTNHGRCKACQKIARMKYLDDMKLNGKFEEYRLKKSGYSKTKEAVKKRFNYYETERYRKSLEKYQLKSKYGVTREWFDKQLKAQDGCCAICGKHYTEQKRRFAIDHCHKTGKVRKLLCSKCNTGLGQFNDSVEILEQALNYLKENM